MPAASKKSRRIRRFFRRLLPRHGVANSPTAGPPSRNFRVPEGGTQTQRPRGVTFPATATSKIQIDISDVPEAIRSKLCLPRHVPVLHVDPEDWAIAQRNFIAPLGHPFDPDDPEKPEEFAIRINLLNGRFVHTQAPQHPWPRREQASAEEDKETTPPSYDWAAVSMLPQPTEITSWSAIFAAQREMSRLLEIQSYIEKRIAKIKTQCIERINEEVNLIPAWQYSYIRTRMFALLSEIVLLDRRTQDIELNRLTQEMRKVLFVRERLSPVSFLSFRGSVCDGGDPWGWDWDLPRRFESDLREGGIHPAGRGLHRGLGASMTRVYHHSATF